MPPMPTLQDLLNLYASSYLTQHAPSTQDQQRRLFRRFARDLGPIPLSCLTPLVLRTYTRHLSRTLAPGSVRHYLDVLSAVLTVAVDELGWLASHPLRHVPKPPLAPGRVRCLTSEERTRLLRECRASHNPWLHLLVLLALSTGCRRGELFALRWQDVDLDRGLLRLAATKNRDRRAVPIPQVALAPLRAWGVGVPATAWVFPSPGRCRTFPGE